MGERIVSIGATGSRLVVRQAAAARPASGLEWLYSTANQLRRFFDDKIEYASPVQNAFTHDDELYQLLPIGLWNNPWWGITMVIAKDVERDTIYAFSQTGMILEVTMKPLYYRTSHIESCTQTEWRSWIAIAAVLGTLVFCCFVFLQMLWSGWQNDDPVERNDVETVRVPQSELNRTGDGWSGEELNGQPMDDESEKIPPQKTQLEDEIFTLVLAFALGWWFLSLFSPVKRPEWLKWKDAQQATRMSPTLLTSSGTNHPGATASNNRNNSLRQRRKKGSRRANRQSQTISFAPDTQILVPQQRALATGEPSLLVPESNTQKQQQNCVGKTTLVQGDELQSVCLSMNANEETDSCPICLDSFQGELASTLCAILPCRHAHCLPCLDKVDQEIDIGSSRADSTRSLNDGRKKRECSICRKPRDRVLEPSVTEIVCMPTIQNRLELLQGISLEDKISIIRSLLRANKFAIFKVERALEDMLMGSLSMPVSVSASTQTTTTMQQPTELSPKEKEQIYLETQRPVLRLRKELKDARWHLITLKRKRLKRKVILEAQEAVQELEHKLLHAIQNCREDTYNRINSSGTMGMVVSSGSNVQVDYHSLHVRDAKKKFDELVLPLLPVLRNVVIITGRGKRSGTGTSVLQSALKSHIENHPDEWNRSHLQWEPIDGNDGVILVKWED